MPFIHQVTVFHIKNFFKGSLIWDYREEMISAIVAAAKNIKNVAFRRTRKRHSRNVWVNKNHIQKGIHSSIRSGCTTGQKKDRVITCTYFITTERINKFTKTLYGVSAVAFLQAGYHFADYLLVNNKINEKTRSDLQECSKKLYTDKLLSKYDCYPASELITVFPHMNSVKNF
jgi:hypothetical protein